MFSLIFWIVAAWLGFMALIVAMGIIQLAFLCLEAFLNWSDRKTGELFKLGKAAVMVRVRRSFIADVGKHYRGPIFLDMGILVCLLVAGIALCW